MSRKRHDAARSSRSCARPRGDDVQPSSIERLLSLTRPDFLRPPAAFLTRIADMKRDVAAGSLALHAPSRLVEQ